MDRFRSPQLGLQFIDKIKVDDLLASLLKIIDSSELFKSSRLILKVATFQFSNEVKLIESSTTLSTFGSKYCW